MSQLFAYICTKSTVDPYIPTATPNTAVFARDVSDAFTALAGGYHVVGQISFFPLQRSVPFHLLCNGQEVAKAAFPELHAFLAETQGTATSPENFVLPNFIASLEPATAAEPETVVEGTVTTPPPPPTQGPPPTEGTGSTAPVTSGPVTSGGRQYRTLVSYE